MRRIIVLLLLLLAMRVILPLGQTASAQSLLTFGFLILGAYTVGELFAQLRLPKIVGYLLAGLLFGPSALAIVSEGTIEALSPVSDLAVALIAFLAGAELRWKEVRENGTKILKILGAELPMTFVGVMGLLLALRQFVPFLADTTWMQAFALASLFASVAILHSPAVTLALLTETGARGPVARTTLGVVLVADVVVILLFSSTLAWATAVAPAAGASGGASIGLVAWEILGSIIVGSVLGGVIALYLRFVQRELLLFAIVIAFFGAEIARLAHVETLLTLLTAGFVTENISRGGEGEQLRHAMERSSAPVFVVFFALAGAEIAVDQLTRLWVIVIPIVLVRTGGIWLGSRIGARWAKASAPEVRYVWLGLISQVGVAIGLASVIAQAYPERGEVIRDVLLAVIAINQTLGPVLFRQALSRSGELNPGPAQPEAQASPQPAA